ncbi:MAG TPA: DUF2203 domain-containing protein [Bryobacteraceae bacterium]|nr:DUF2203 domain-containing protein [Bryobacteraceae bacterium]
MPRYFTLPEAERLLPQVERFLRDALFHKSEAQKAHRELDQSSELIRYSGGARVSPGAVLAVRARRDTSLAALKEAIEQIAETGAMVKDLDTGLIDFLSRFEDRDVCLCWKLGESGIGFWHSTAEGFRGRKPIDREFLQGHSGEAGSGHLN